MTNLYDKLREYQKSDYYGFHMPGHKRNESRFGMGLPYGIDITEIDGFDDLHHAEDVIKNAEQRAARLYKADETHFLVNGSTVGILSGILGSTKRGDKILVARNCHKSVYHAIYMHELVPVYVYPQYEKELHINGKISVEDIRNELENNKDIKAAVIVSPTYDGVVSDVKEIAELVHSYNISLIVDEAHGAHFGFHPYFPDNANVLGADIVIHSVHKTLPSLTQTALIHLNGTLIDRERVCNYLHMLQSSSPSYILMAGIDYCMDILEKRGQDLFEEYAENISKLRESLRDLKKLEVLKPDDEKEGWFDNSKFVISVRNTTLTSRELYKILLDKYHLQMEMAGGSYVLAMTSIGDTKEGLERLRQALYEIDKSCEKNSDIKRQEMYDELPKLPFVYKSAVTDIKKRQNEEFVLWEDSIGKISTEYAYIYPPGIPLIVPGEMITQEALNVLNLYEKLDFSIEGIQKEKHIGVLKNG